MNPLRPAVFAVGLIFGLMSAVRADPPGEEPAKAPPKRANAPTLLKDKSIDELIAGLKDKGLSDRRQAAIELRNRGVDAVRAIPALTEAVKSDTEAAMRSSAAEALGAMGSVARTAVPTLLAALKDADPLVRETAAESLADIHVDVKTVVPAIMTLLEDPDMNVRCAACISLSDFGTAASEAVPQLKKALQDKHPFVREAAADALAAIQKAGRKLGS